MENATIIDSPVLSSIALLALFLLAGCQQQMGQQPSYRPLEENDFFRDERSARPLVDGTVAQGHLQTDRALFIGQHGTAAMGTSGAALRKSETEGIYPPLPPQPYVDEFPFPVTRAVLDRGRERFNIYCVPCHAPLGYGDGVVVDRGYTRPPSFHNKRLRDAPLGYLFGIATHGVGSMPDYAEQVPPHDRWAVVSYIRVLQASQDVRVEDLPHEERMKLEEQRGQQR